MLFRALNPISTWFSKNSKDWPLGANHRIIFGQHVLWHSYNDDDDGRGGRHLPANTLSIYRQIGDVEVDEILRLMEHEQKHEGGGGGGGGGGDSHHPRTIAPGEDILTRATQLATAIDGGNDAAWRNENNKTSTVNLALVKFYQRYAKFPSWVDRDQLERGQQVYLAYLPAISLSLYYRSLVPGFSIPHLAHVLKTTGYLAPPASRKRVLERLMDTGLLLLNVMVSLDALEPGTGEGWKSCLQVRILHAKVRRAILQRTHKRAWDSHTHGIPINEEDMAATLLAFSINSLVGVEILLGFPLPRQERLDFLALWRYLGWLLGIRVLNDDDDIDYETTSLRHDDDDRIVLALDPCGPGWIQNQPNALDHSYAIFQSIIAHLMHPDAVSVEVSHHLLRQGRDNEERGSLDDKNKSTTTTRRQQENWFYYRCLQCRRFIGPYLADALELPLNPNLFYRWRTWLFSSIMLSVISLYTFLALPISPFRKLIVSFHQRHLRDIAKQWNKDHMERVKEQISDKNKTCQFAMLAIPTNS